MSKESMWFAHDCHDGSEPAIEAMCCQYKMQGYGCWWKLVEMLRREEEYRIKIDWKFAYKVLAIRLMTTEEKTKQFINDLINVYGLLQTDGEYIWSDWLVKRMQYMEEKKKVMSERGKKGNEAKRRKKEAALAAEDERAAT